MANIEGWLTRSRALADRRLRLSVVLQPLHQIPDVLGQNLVLEASAGNEAIAGVGLRSIMCS
jgi:hypothetical protein